MDQEQRKAVKSHQAYTNIAHKNWLAGLRTGILLSIIVSVALWGLIWLLAVWATS